MSKQKNWKNDRLQFARLIAGAESLGLFNSVKYRALREEMGLSDDLLQELIERAKTVYQDNKCEKYSAKPLQPKWAKVPVRFIEHPGGVSYFRNGYAYESFVRNDGGFCVDCPVEHTVEALEKGKAKEMTAEECRKKYPREYKQIMVAAAREVTPDLLGDEY